MPQHTVTVEVRDALGAVATGSAILTVEAAGYQTIAAQDWNFYPDKAALAGLFNVEGDLHLQAPVLPKEAFYDLVADPLGVFGKVIRYNGDPSLNTNRTDLPGRTATHGVGLPNLLNTWVRQFIRFSPEWTPVSTVGGSGSHDHKLMFLRSFTGTRWDWTVPGLRGIGNSASFSLTGQAPTNGFNLPWHNVVPLNQNDGFGYPDSYPMYRVAINVPTSGNFNQVNPSFGPGDGQWYECVMHVKTVGDRAEFSFFFRRYTAGGGVVSPGPWRVYAASDQLPGGVPPVRFYEMGINRNRQYDAPMSIYWGPYEVVDGAQFPNPWGLPGG